MTIKHLLTALFVAAMLPATAQDHFAQLDVKTSTICDMCKKTIEAELIYEKGIKKVEVHLEDHMVHVRYDDRKTEPATIRKAIAAIGYDADEVKADEKAWEKLPACCKAEGCGKSTTH